MLGGHTCYLAKVLPTWAPTSTQETLGHRGKCEPSFPPSHLACALTLTEMDTTQLGTLQKFLPIPLLLAPSEMHTPSSVLCI